MKPRDEPNIPALPRRRVLISEMGSHSPIAPGGISPLPELGPAKAPQEIEDRKGEAHRIVKRLLAIIEDHRVSALRMSFTLDTAALERVVSALEAELRREDTSAILSDTDAVRHYVLSSLYEDLLAEPSNILHTTHIAADVIRYEAMEPAFWQECVAALRKSITP